MFLVGWLTGLELLSRSVTCVFSMLRKYALNWRFRGVAAAQHGLSDGWESNG